jgi:dipeptidyl aminopeptidase/acylaminoacyl peptidase
MIEALERKGIPYAYLAFEGEGHGFRKAENRRRAVEAELDFLARILGFEPADEVEPVEIRNLIAASR